MRTRFFPGTLAFSFFILSAIGQAGESTGQGLPAVELRISEVEFSVLLKQYEKIFTAVSEVESEHRMRAQARFDLGTAGQPAFDEEGKKLTALWAKFNALASEARNLRLQLSNYGKSLNSSGTVSEAKK